MVLFAFYWSLLKIPKFWTYEIPTWKNLGPMKYPQEKSLDPQNTREKKLGTHEILTQKYFGPTKYPQEKISNPWNTHEKKLWTHEISTRKKFELTKYPREKTLDPRNTRWGKTQMLKKNYVDKINGSKNALLFLSRAPIHNRFTFNLWFLYELKHKACLSKPGSGIFHFRFRFVFVKVYIFAQQNTWTLWL